jgi:membrane protein
LGSLGHPGPEIETLRNRCLKGQIDLPMADPTVPPAPPVKAPHPVHGVMQTLGFMLARIRADAVTRVAASLSFTTALAVVPALAVVLAILTAFPAFESVRVTAQDFILSNVVPDTGLKMRDQIASFVNAAGQLTAFGVVGLAITSLMLLLTIEASFNEIFKVQRPRPLLMRLLVLWTLITVGPFLFGLSFTLFGYFAAAQMWLGDDMAKSVDVVLGQIAPTIVAWIGIAFLYVVVPNRRVQVKDALIGAGAAAILFGLLRYGFAAFVASMTSYQAVYGAVAAVPVFLVWVYLNWIVIMSGAVVTASLADWRYANAGRSDKPLDRLALAMEVIAKLATAQNAGAAIPTRVLARTLGAPDVVLSRVLENLRQGRFVAVTDEGGWMLARDLDRIALADVVHQFGLGLDFAGVGAVNSERLADAAKRLHHHLGRAAESERALLSVTLAKVVGTAEEALTAQKE